MGKTTMNGIYGSIFVCGVVALILLGVTGWAKNVYKLCEYDVRPQVSSTIAVIRIVGVVTPIGPIVGYMTFDGEREVLMPIKLTR